MDRSKLAAFGVVALAAVAAGLILGARGGEGATECPVRTDDAYDLAAEEIEALHACLAGAMAAGYRRSGNAAALAYRGWAPVQHRPGPDPSHGDRILMTYANPLAAERYLAFAAEGVAMPVGAVLAKESIAIRDRVARAGPLFLMEKLGDAVAPATGGWLYIGFQPSGEAMTFPQSFCHDCHSAFVGQDSLAYPRPELRLGP